MTARAQHRRALRLPVPGPWRTLLLLGLLAGLFGMHALGPANAVAGGSHHSPHSHARGMDAAHTPAPSDESVCHGDGTDDGHVQHADATCASGAVGGGPVLPALAPDPAGSAVPGDLDRRNPALAPDGGRAPPSLAELQILRT
ncbi:DUF6153 family protein [Streptomyces lanatus]|uniref:DUF6153 family protein n=1 Tax=Streptomyces lanatus TaxID=66900 RepID=A0ABV1XRM2_9ACTN|nr:DUF6153 family protein [Streptomyces lanatus]GHH04831.1 hypothetical protein GCM10018780_35680 [Streptomyces lanatus]